MSQLAIISNTTHPDYPTFPSTTPGVKNALSAGHRWLIFNDEVTTLGGSSINLDVYSGSTPESLRLQGAGPGATRVVRNHGNGPLIQSTDPWAIQCTGIQFDGNRSSFGNYQHICQFRHISGSYFENCSWVESGGDGLALGHGSSGRAESVRFVECHFDNNDSNGINIANGTSFTFIGGSAINNRRHGIFWAGPNPSTRVGGVGSILGMTVVGTLSNLTDWGMWLDQVYQILVQNCHFKDTDVKVDVDSRYCMLERNYLESGSIVIDGGPTNVQQHNL